MKKCDKFELLFIVTGVVFIIGCIFSTFEDYRSDEEMSVVANEAFDDYLFELAIDRSLFSIVETNITQNGIKYFKWLANDSLGHKVSVEITVSRERNVEPGWTITGSVDDWDSFVGTKHKRMEVAR